MFGSGIGELNVYIRTIGSTSDPDKKIWGLNGDAGNNWYMAQAPVASSRPFKVHIFFLIVLGFFYTIYTLQRLNRRGPLNFKDSTLLLHFA